MDNQAYINFKETMKSKHGDINDMYCLNLIYRLIREASPSLRKHPADTFISAPHWFWDFANYDLQRTIYRDFTEGQEVKKFRGIELINSHDSNLTLFHFMYTYTHNPDLIKQIPL
jgi:hypothetical protein